MPEGMIEASGYVVVQAVRSRWYPDQVAQSAKIVRATQKKPTLVDDQVAVKIKIRLPAAVFEAFEAGATIEIPDSLIDREVTVTAEDANV